MIGFGKAVLDLEAKRMSRQIVFLIIGAAFSIRNSGALAKTLQTIVIISLILTFIQASIAHATDPNLIAWWKFDAVSVSVEEMAA